MYKKLPLTVLFFTLLFSAAPLAATWNDGDSVTHYLNGYVGLNNSAPDAMLTLGANSGSQGYIRFRGGTAAEGNIFHDNIYGLYLDTSANALPIRIDGSRLVLGMLGNVGIGTTAPWGKLHVYEAGDAQRPLIINSNSTLETAGKYIGMMFAGASGGVPNAVIDAYTFGANNIGLRFGTFNGALQNSMVITGVGNVGIGMTNPSDRLTVSGNVAIRSLGGSVIDASNLFISDTSTGSIGAGAGISFVGRYSGNPAEYALVATIKSMKENNTAGDYGGALAFGSHGGALTERMRIGSTGNVGIGTTIPNELLDVSGGNLASIRLTSTGAPAIRLYSTGADSGARNWALLTNLVQFGDFDISQSNTRLGNPQGAGGTSRLHIDNNGNVGIG
ncbi:MAG: hypothetical protein WC838_07330, partial [Candidatus Margulisiibacteriota bacterium]